MNIRRREPVPEPRPVRCCVVGGEVRLEIDRPQITAAEARMAADELHDCAREAERYERERAVGHG